MKEASELAAVGERGLLSGFRATATILPVLAIDIAVPVVAGV